LIFDILVDEPVGGGYDLGAQLCCHWLVIVVWIAVEALGDERHQFLDAGTGNMVRSRVVFRIRPYLFYRLNLREIRRRVDDAVEILVEAIAVLQGFSLKQFFNR